MAVPTRGGTELTLQKALGVKKTAIWFSKGVKYLGDHNVVIGYAESIVFVPYSSKDGFCRAYELRINSPNEIFHLKLSAGNRSYGMRLFTYAARNYAKKSCEKIKFYSKYFRTNSEFNSKEINDYWGIIKKVLINWTSKEKDTHCEFSMQGIKNMNVYPITSPKALEVKVFSSSCGMARVFSIDLTQDLNKNNLKYSSTVVLD